MKDRLSGLAHRFRQQQQFATAYAPLYAALFGSCADWLDHDARDPLVKWLLEASEGRAAFDVTNLLAAGLHREVLIGHSDVSALAEFYPTAVNNGSVRNAFSENSGAAGQVSPTFKLALREAILARQDVLQKFMQTYTVQTNETGRGIVWLLPVCFTNWDGIHLVDIGASAGLNLVAEKRAYRFLAKKDRRELLDLGYGQHEQFIIKTTGVIGRVLPQKVHMPKILSRNGCDLHPFQLQTAVDEQTLASFVWADHVDRLQRLREGIAAFHETMESSIPIRLHEVILPEELPLFLEEQVPGSNEPVVIYNTYIKMYLPEKGSALQAHIAQWADLQQRPILWLQWEPPNFVDLDTGNEPEYGWLAWTLDYWHAGKHEQSQIGWVHPHGQQLQLLPGYERWIAPRHGAGCGHGQAIGQ